MAGKTRLNGHLLAHAVEGRLRSPGPWRTWSQDVPSDEPFAQFEAHEPWVMG